MTRAETRHPTLSASVLLVGACIHAVLCGPAISCRGSPPIDPIWYGVTYIWPVAVLITAYLDSLKFGNRVFQLIYYCMATAFFSAGTWITVVPRNVNPIEMLVIGGILFPFHLLIAFVVDSLGQLIYSFGRTLVKKTEVNRNFNFSVFFMMAFSVWIGFMFAIPLGFKSFVNISTNNEAVERADADWEQGAFVYVNGYDDCQVLVGDCVVLYEHDLVSGLEYKSKRSDRFAEKYNRRIQH